MTKSRVLLFFPLLILLVAVEAQTVSAQTLPDKVRTLLDQKYEGWKFSEGDPSCKRESVVVGDFDGNGKKDYAVMIRQRDTPIIAFLADGEGYKSYQVQWTSSRDEYLTVAPKGQTYSGLTGNGLDDMEILPKQKLKTDTLVSNRCGYTTLSYRIYDNGKFKLVVQTDE